MTRSDRDPDAYDRIRDDALTTEAARIAELEAQLAAATERERVCRDYIAILENCQDHYYRATETEEAMKYAALAAAQEGAK